MEEIRNGIKAFYAKTSTDWRQWLAENHQKENSVWLILYKKGSSKETISHSEAVDQALCYGWIDSLTNKRDEESRYQFFSKRKPKGNWSAINKAKVEKLTKDNLMAAQGLEMVELAKKNGMWDALNDVENLIVPKDLEEELTGNKEAYSNWQKFPPSSQKIILKWISEAKRDETRRKRINETIELAAKNIRAHH